MELPGRAELGGRTRELLISAGYVVLVAVALQLRHTPARGVCIALVAAAGTAAALLAWRRARAIADIALSRIGSAAQGYVEVVGRASVAPDELIRSPISGLECIWWRFRVYTRDGSRDGWRLTDSGTSSTTFEIDDGSGTCRVDPDFAEVVAPDVRTTVTGDEKRVEEMLFGGVRIYVLGEFSTRGGTGLALDERADVGALLAEWKRDAAELRRRFDRNRDGTIDLEEWEAARREAEREVRQQHRELRTRPDLHVMHAPRDGRLFLISPLSPQALRRRYQWWAAGHLGVALVALAVLIA